MTKVSVVMPARASARQSFLIVLALLCANLSRCATEGLGSDPASASPRKQESKSEAPQRLAVRVDLVNVEVMVTDERGHFVNGLKRENFRVLDEGIVQPISHFAPVETPAQVLVLIETGPAVYLIHRQHLQAAYALLAGLAPDDRVALATYDQALRPALSFTQDKNALAQAIAGLRYNLGMTELNLFGSLGAALDWLQPLPGKKAIVLLSTGLDSSGTARWEAFAEKVRASEVMILPVALGGELRAPDKKRKAKDIAVRPFGEGSGPSFAQADRALQAIAQMTGGRAYFPRDARDFAGIYREIASVLRHQYSLGFSPAARDARFHRIEVQVVDANGRALVPAEGNPAYRITSRQSYLAPAP